MAVATEIRRPARPPAFRFDAWALLGLAVAGLVVAPLLVIPGSFVSPRVGELWDITSAILPDVLADTAIVTAGVGAGTVLLGGALAALVSFYEFPGRRWFDWALVLPLAIPAYVLTFVYLGRFGTEGALPLRSPGGAVVILTLALYPYVYLLARAAFRGQSRNLIEASRSLGMGRGRAIARVAVPLARPALAAGALLAMMETLADFGSVQLLGVKTLTVSIYQVWFGAFDRLAASQLATFLMGITLLILFLERTMRGRQRYAEQSTGASVERVRLRGARAAVATLFPLAVLIIAFAGPVAQLVGWAFESWDDTLVRSGFGTWLRNSLMLSVLAAVIVVPTALLLVYGLRVAPSRLNRATARLASIGYGVPGSVVAVGVLLSLAWVDHRIQDVAGWVGLSVGLLFTGSALGMVFAYVVRFLALGFQAFEAQMTRLSPNLDDAARSLGADRLEVMWRVHLPLMRVAILTSALLVFVETMKELPATILLRPLGGDTLATAVWHSTSESLWEAAAPPALAIIAVALVPVIVLVRTLDRSGSTDVLPS
ncbi:MAG TPA: iron ABC transporter permease [Thermoleophilaceae bacterium]|nr:iron ABC transporter permease [Thermoleophilaceae bacterium]